MRRPLVLALLFVAVVVAVVDGCSCSDPVAPDEGEGEGDAGEGEGEGDVGEGEGEGDIEPASPCFVIVVGDNLPGAVASRVTELLVTRTLGDDVVVLDADATLPEFCAAGSRLLAFGHSSISHGLLPADDVAAAGPEGYVLRSFVDVDGRFDAIAVDGNAATRATPSPGGAAYGSYALLEELGFAFLHPLAPTLPDALPTTLPTLDVTSSPRWPVRNIHLHTMHPLELTDLLNGWGPDGVDDEAGWQQMRPEWSRFLEWEVANGQNEVEWVLLEADSWAAFAQSTTRQQRLTGLVDDCHAWGISCGIDVPIALQQQHTFRLIHDVGDRAVEFAQLRERTAWLMDAGFDFLSTENGSTEFTNPGAANMLAWMNELTRFLDEERGGRQARIKIHCSTGQVADGFVDRATGEPLNFNFLPTYADARLGVMPHTVQMYGLDDPAPTYGNDDFAAMHGFLQTEAGRRSVIWHPETAYWVSVDVDVPLFLPVYAERRVADLQLLADDEDAGRMGRDDLVGSHIDGQSIFSSGWEWGYWLNDVVAARAAWDPFHGQTTSTGAMRAILRPLSRALGAAGPAVVDEVVSLAAAQHDVLVKGIVDGDAPDDVVRNNGFAYLAGVEAFDDLNDVAADAGLHAPVTQPDKLGLVEMRNPLHAAPRFSGVVDRLLAEMLRIHADAAVDLDTLIVADGPATPLFREIADGVDVTRLRAAQVQGLYTYVDNLLDLDPAQRTTALAAARAALDDAAAVIERREAAYRVPVARIASWRENPTAYDFTYLWTAHSQYFWWRDEGKAVDAPRSPCYQNIINPADVAVGEGGVNDAARLLNELLDGGFLDAAGGCLAAPQDEPQYPQDGLRSRP
jgi:hypothetical protein